jgi:hypothetical protein
MSKKTMFVLCVVGIVLVNVLICVCIKENTYDLQDPARLQKEFETVLPQVDAEAQGLYGCPGCPSSFMGFAEDMCNRGRFENFTVTDGVNTLQCSEVQR